MADLIDSESQDELSGEHSAVAFNIPDLKALAAKILRRANDVANQKIEQAKDSIAKMGEESRKEGYDKGYAQGIAKGEEDGRIAGDKAAREEFAGKVGPLLGAMQVLLQELAARKTELQAKAEADMLRLGMEVARRIVRRELAENDDFVVPIVREAIALTNNRSDLVVRMHPDDEKAIIEELPNLHAIFSDLGRVQLEPDNNVDRGGVVVQTRQSEVDMKLWRQFEALERALVGDTDGMELLLDVPEELAHTLPDEKSEVQAIVDEIQEPEASFEDVEKVLRNSDRKEKGNAAASDRGSVVAGNNDVTQEVGTEASINPPVESYGTEVSQVKPDEGLGNNQPVVAPQQTAGTTDKLINSPEASEEVKAAVTAPPDDSVFTPIDAGEVPADAQLVADNAIVEEVTGKTVAGSAAAISSSSLSEVKSVSELSHSPEVEKIIDQSIKMHLGNARR